MKEELTNWEKEYIDKIMNALYESVKYHTTQVSVKVVTSAMLSKQFENKKKK